MPSNHNFAISMAKLLIFVDIGQYSAVVFHLFITYTPVNSYCIYKSSNDKRKLVLLCCCVRDTIISKVPISPPLRGKLEGDFPIMNFELLSKNGLKGKSINIALGRKMKVYSPYAGRPDHDFLCFVKPFRLTSTCLFHTISL